MFRCHPTGTQAGTLKKINEKNNIPIKNFIYKIKDALAI